MLDCSSPWNCYSSIPYQLGWTGAAIVMVKVQVGLGVLSLPSTLHTLGMVPGVILMLVICAMNSCTLGANSLKVQTDPKLYRVRLGRR